VAIFSHVVEHQTLEIKFLNIGDSGCNLEKLKVGSMTTLWPLLVLIPTLQGFGLCNIRAQKRIG
jgi:hypothetical protein